MGAVVPFPDRRIRVADRVAFGAHAKAVAPLLCDAPQLPAYPGPDPALERRLRKVIWLTFLFCGALLLSLWLIPVGLEGLGAMLVEAREAEFRG